MSPLATRNLPDKAKVRPPHPDVVPVLAVSKFLMDWHLSHPEQQEMYMKWLRDDAMERAQKRNAASEPPQAPLMLPAPTIAGLLPAGAVARPVPETAPILNLVSKLRVQIPLTVIPSTRVNPAWVSAWAVAHTPVRGEVGSKRLRDLVMGGTPEQFAAWAFSRIEDAPTMLQERGERVAA